MNKHWSTVLESLKELNENISANLDSLLTGINPKGLRETSKSLKEIMDTMNKSVQTMNLEKVMSELKVLKSGNIAYVPAQSGVKGEQPESIAASTGINVQPTSLKAPGESSKATKDSDWVDPHEKAKKEEEDQHLLKPSDFFGS
jgi:hypothetical protein